MADDPDIITDLAYMASKPELFTKKEMAEKMVEAARMIATLRQLVGIRQEIELEDAEPIGMRRPRSHFRAGTNHLLLSCSL